MTGDLHLALSRLSRNRAPVIAAVNGTAAGAGFSLRAADLAIAEEQAVFTMAYTNVVARRQFDLFCRATGLTHPRIDADNRLLTAPEALDWGWLIKWWRVVAP